MTLRQRGSIRPASCSRRLRQLMGSAAQMPDAGPPSNGDVLRSTAKGAGWILAWRGAKRMLGLINTLILARLLIPADFGLVAIGAALSGALGSLTSIGVEEALIREARSDNMLYDTGFTLNLVRAAIMATVLATVALPAAHFYHDERLANVVYVLAFCTLAAGITNIGTVDFMRHLDFGKEFVLLSIPRLVALVVTISVALVTQSYYALLAGIVVSRVLTVALSYTMHPYRPRITFKEWRSLAKFSIWTWINGIILTVRDQSSTFLIGHALGESSVGAYSVGIDLATLPTNELLSPFVRAGFPAFAAIRRNEGDAARAFLRMFGLAMFLTVPAAIGISAISDPMERLLLGPKWLAVIPIMQIFAVLTALTAAGAVSEVLLSAYGRLERMFGMYVFSAVLRLLALVLLVPKFGLLGAVWAIGAVGALECLFWVGIVARTFTLSPWTVVGRAARPLIAVGCMAALLYVTGLGWHTVHGGLFRLIGDLLLSAAAGAFFYLAVQFGIWAIIGRPAGAEADFLQVLGGAYCRWLRWQRLHLGLGQRT